MKLFRSMKKRFRKRDIQRLCIMAGVIGVLSIKSLMACGDFRMPSNHFEGVSSQGYVSIWKQLDTLDLGDASLPILLGIQTYRAIPSGELGSGWIMPLFDSGILQRDENTFDMITPDGTMDFFSRDRDNQNILHGSSGWTGEIQGNDITVYSKCGSGWKMVFRQGRLDTLSKGSHELRIQRDQLNRPIGITKNGISRLTMTRDEKTGLVSALEMNGKKYLFGYDGKPRVENVGGQNLVGGVEPSLHKITYPKESGKEGGKSESYDFAVTEKMLPSLKITDAQGKERLISWDMSGHILTDGDWNYTVKPSTIPNGNASIARTNPKNQSESWFKDDATGKETSRQLDGSEIVRTFFTSGLLAGKTRSKEVIKDGVTKKLFSATYDENARQVRALLEDGSIKTYQYSSDGKKQSMTQSKGGKDLLSAKYDDQGRMTSATNASGHTETFKYNDSLHQKLTYLDGKLLYEQYLGSGNQWMQRNVYDTKTGNKRLSIWKQFDSLGKLTISQISDATGKIPTVVRKYVYDDAGKVVQEINSRIGTINYNYTPDGKVIKNILKQAIDSSGNNKS